MNTASCNTCGSPLRVVDGLCPSCVAHTITSFIKQTVANDLPGVPGYEILTQIGRGGMGVVFRALRLDDETEVAIKVMPAHLADRQDLLERLTREAATLRQLTHPHILRILDSGITPDGRWFMATTLATGGDLAKKLQHGALPVSEALRLFQQILAAINHAHQNGITHRDIKPANILLDEAGNAHVADFSLAKHLQHDFQLTQTTEVFGTPYYIAPEIRRGAANADHRADIFSLGVLLHEMLTGKLPIGQYEPSSHDKIISRCLQESPGKRPQSVTELEAAFHPKRSHAWLYLGAALALAILGFSFVDFDGHKPSSSRTNSLGMTLIPLPGTQHLVCTHETRIRDFETYSRAKNLPLTGAETRWRHSQPGMEPTPEHPVTPVSKIMADRFCDWLTEREQKSQQISHQMRYRLPTDAEWTQMAQDLPKRPISSSGAQSVGTHPANKLGLFDLEANVAEWTSTPASATTSGEFIVRGGSYLSDKDRQISRAIIQTDGTGFRIVLEQTNQP